MDSIAKIQTLRPAGKTTGQKLTLCAAHTHIVRILGKTLDGTKSLGHTLGLIGELKEKLRTNDIATKGRTNRANRTRDRASRRTLEKEVVELIATHELQDTRSLLLLLLTKHLELRLELTGTVVELNPLLQVVLDFRVVRHCFFLFLRRVSFLRPAASLGLSWFSPVDFRADNLPSPLDFKVSKFPFSSVELFRSEIRLLATSFKSLAIWVTSWTCPLTAFAVAATS